MSWLYVPERAGELVQRSGFAECAPFATLNTIHFVWKSSRLESRIDSWMMRRYGMTLLRSTDSLGVDLWILSMLRSLAARSPMRERRIATTLTRISGHRAGGLLNKCNPGLSSSKTSKGYWVSTGTFLQFLPTFPRSGIMRNGLLYQLPTLARRIKDHGFGSWPTPTRHTHHPAKNRRSDFDPTLGDLLGGIPNPRWQEWLMGWCISWTSLTPLETDKFLLWLRKHGIGLQDKRFQFVLNLQRMQIHEKANPNRT